MILVLYESLESNGGADRNVEGMDKRDSHRDGGLPSALFNKFELFSALAVCIL